jgi:ubiquinol-cytochrome c reductase cytochrome b subunit
MSGPSTYEPKNGFTKWMDARLPILRFNHDLMDFPTPKNLNYWWTFGGILAVCLVVQIVTGVVLAMHYVASTDDAFASVERIMRDVDYGWLIRNIHANGASMFFLAVYIHMFRGLYYGSYKSPREVIWILGVVIYLLMMATAFMGYVLPWGQMSYWGAQVIINLFGAIPTIGEPLTEWIRGDYFISDATLNRFFALHVIALPLALLALVVLHLAALHEVGSNNPDGIDIKQHKDEHGVPLDGIPFHPYYTVKDLFGVAMFLLLFAFIIFFWPEAGGLFLEHDNFTPADPLVTPEHIKPVWYFTPYYAILKAVPDKLMGVLLMGCSVMILFLLPWLDRSPVRSIRYKGAWYRILVFVFAVAFVRLGMLGMAEGTPAQTWEMRIWSFVYFAFFALLWLLSKGGPTKQVPERVTH